MHFAGATLTALGLGGCAQYWDDVTSRPFQFKHIFVSDHPDPMAVLSDSKSNSNQRARALASLKEPKENGGKEEEQKTVLAILGIAATGDEKNVREILGMSEAGDSIKGAVDARKDEEHYVYSRIAAISSLGTFKDDRAVALLAHAYYQGGKLKTPEQRMEVECAALRALGETKNPKAIEPLIVALRQPASEELKNGPIVVLQNRQVRITAARALGNFKEKQATDALLEVLEKEKDIAMLDRAHDALCSATGKNYSNDFSVWDQFLHHPEQPPPKEDSGIRLTSWFSIGK
jgi:hypothetical protein